MVSEQALSGCQGASLAGSGVGVGVGSGREEGRFEGCSGGGGGVDDAHACEGWRCVTFVGSAQLPHTGGPCAVEEQGGLHVVISDQ